MTPHEVLRYTMDCERKDPNKRFAFVNDIPRINGLMKYTGLSYEDAVSYTMIGCNEICSKTNGCNPGTKISKFMNRGKKLLKH